MTNTPWLDELINREACNLGQKNTHKNKDVLLEKIGGTWHSLAINQNQIKSGGAHRDFRDATNSLNCVVPYGDWMGGDLLLWELRKRVELKEGEALFFRGSSILHNCWNISNGSRN